jgi:hypothetical protein
MTFSPEVYAQHLIPAHEVADYLVDNYRGLWYFGDKLEAVRKKDSTYALLFGDRSQDNPVQITMMWFNSEDLPAMARDRYPDPDKLFGEKVSVVFPSGIDLLRRLVEVYLEDPANYRCRVSAPDQHGR